MAGITGLSGLTGLSGEFGAGLDWYVDSVNGNDANSGTSSAKAFQTIGALEAAGIAAGDKIGLAKGGQWREQLDVTVNNVTIDVYGSGAAPILDASNVAANASFAKTGGRVNVYEIDVTPEWNGGGKDFVNVWEDDTFLTRASDVANCDATAGSYYPSAEGAGTITLYVHATDSSDVTANGKVYEYTHRKFGLDMSSGSGHTVTGITTQRNLHEDGSARFGRSSTITDCNFNDGSVHNMLVQDGCNLTGCGTSGAYHTTNITMNIFNEGTPAGLGVTFTNCTAQLGTINSVATGFSGHNNVGGSFGTVTYDGCTCVNLNVGFSASDCDNMVVSDCTITTCNRGIRPAVPTAISNTTWTGSARGVEVLQAIIVTIDQFYGCGSGSALGIYTNQASTITVTNSQFGGTQRATYIDNAGASLTFNNNACDSTLTSYLFLINAGTTYVGDNNCFENDGNKFRLGATTSNLAWWQGATSQDGSSSIGSCSLGALPC